MAHIEEITALKAALEAFEKKWYDEGFADAKNSVEPIIHQAGRHRFRKGWLADLQVMGVAKDSPLRNLEQITYPHPPPPVQTQAITADKEDTPSMRELVRAIDTHVEMVDLQVTSTLNADVNAQSQQLQPGQLIEEPPTEPVDDVALSQSTNPVIQD